MPFLRAYKHGLLLAFALSPLPLIAYLQIFQSPDLLYHDLLAHEILIGAAIGLSIAMTYVAYRCYLVSGEPTLRWLTLGLLGMTIIYAPHGILTRLATDNPPVFLLFGPASRFAMAALWLLAFAQISRPADEPAARSGKSLWWPWLLAFVLFDLLILFVAVDPSMPRMQARLVLESSAVALNLASLILLLRHAHPSPLLQFFGFSLFFFVLSSASFFLAAPWNHQWWLAHAVFAAGFLTMSFGLARAFLTTGNLVDVFSEEQLIRRLEMLATTDELTGLPNRRRFMHRFADELERRTPTPFAVILMDLDNFKVINDSLGHEAGDELLKCMSQRLLHVLRQEDTLARLGGDEFALLVPDVADEAQAAHAAERLLQALREPVLFHGKRIQPQASIGIALFPGDGRDATSLLKAADAAMYESKGQGRHRYSFHTPAMNARATARLQTEHQLRSALSRGQFCLHYQPQVHLQEGQICGAEALLRWNHPKRGCISAGEFIAIAEESGMIHDLGAWVLRQACEDIQSWEDHLPDDFRLAINLSGQQLLAPDGFARIMKIIANSGIDQRRLVIELEVTETTLMRSPLVLTLLSEFRQHGIQLALDDFGTGYSSLAQLHELPVNRLKIAGAFIQRMSSDKSSRSVVRTIVQLGHDLELAVLAEGVETPEQAELLRQFGCHEAQGFLFYPALPSPQLLALMPASDRTAELRNS